MRSRFPASSLGQERDALEVRAALASSDRPRAAELARAFVRSYPQSPLRPAFDSLATAGAGAAP
jgi:hypothetical protein